MGSQQQPAPRGRGIVSLTNGSYQAYGQNLEINDGEIILTGHPIDNPRLDIQAIRDIFGDAQVEQAGVTITGNARNPEIRLFTNPPTSEEKALAYVATGADFDHAAGQGAINVGFYLAAKTVRQLRHRPVRIRQRALGPLRTVPPLGRSRRQRRTRHRR